MVFDSAFGQFMTNTFGGFDRMIFAFFGGMQNDLLNWLNIALAGCGTEIFVAGIAVLGLALCFFKRYRKVGLILLLSAIFVYVICGMIVNPLAGRLRPYNACQADSQYFQWYLNAGAAAEGVYSFPSKHTAFDLCAAIALLLYFYRDVHTKKAKIWGWILVVVSVVVGLSRIYLMVHYPTDVIAGLVFGLLLGLLVYWLSGLINKFCNYFQQKFAWSRKLNLDKLYEKKTNKEFNYKIFTKIIIAAAVLMFAIGAAKIALGVNGHQEKCQYRGNDFACMNEADDRVFNEKTGEWEDRCKLHK